MRQERGQAKRRLFERNREGDDYWGRVKRRPFEGKWEDDDYYTPGRCQVFFPLIYNFFIHVF